MVSRRINGGEDRIQWRCSPAAAPRAWWSAAPIRGLWRQICRFLGQRGVFRRWQHRIKRVVLPDPAWERLSVEVLAPAASSGGGLGACRGGVGIGGHVAASSGLKRGRRRSAGKWWMSASSLPCGGGTWWLVSLLHSLWLAATLALPSAVVCSAAGENDVLGCRFLLEGVVVQHQCIPSPAVKMSPSESSGSVFLNRTTTASSDVVPSLEALSLEPLSGGERCLLR